MCEESMAWCKLFCSITIVFLLWTRIQEIFNYLHGISRAFWNMQIEEGGITFLGSEYGQESYDTTASFFHEMMQQGVLIYRENHLCLPGEITNLVRERECYMADYVINDAGRLCEVRLDKLPDGK